MKLPRYSVLFEPAEEGGYIARVPALDYLTTQGETLADARRMVRDAVRAYCESLLKDGLPLPTDVTLKGTPRLERVAAGTRSR